MKSIKCVPFEVIVQAWLKAEWRNPIFDQIRSQVPQSLIDDEDFGNQQNSELRYQLLGTLRSPMLDSLPQDLGANSFIAPG